MSAEALRRRFRQFPSKGKIQQLIGGYNFSQDIVVKYRTNGKS